MGEVIAATIQIGKDLLTHEAERTTVDEVRARATWCGWLSDRPPGWGIPIRWSVCQE